MCLTATESFHVILEKIVDVERCIERCSALLVFDEPCPPSSGPVSQTFTTDRPPFRIRQAAFTYYKCI